MFFCPLHNEVYEYAPCISCRDCDHEWQKVVNNWHYCENCGLQKRINTSPRATRLHKTRVKSKKV